MVNSSPSNLDLRVVRSELPLDLVVSALELNEFALDLEVSAVELKESALDRNVSPPNDLEVGEEGTCRERGDCSDEEGVRSSRSVSLGGWL